MWQNSTDINEKIVEIETSKPAPKTLVIADEIKAKEKYSQTLCMAEEEILLKKRGGVAGDGVTSPAEI